MKIWLHFCRRAKTLILLVQHHVTSLRIIPRELPCSAREDSQTDRRYSI